MSAGVYANINGVTRKGKKLYAKVNGVVRPIKELWVRVNGVARKIYSSAVTWTYETAEGTGYDPAWNTLNEAAWISINVPHIGVANGKITYTFDGNGLIMHPGQTITLSLNWTDTTGDRSEKRCYVHTNSVEPFVINLPSSSGNSGYTETYTFTSDAQIKELSIELTIAGILGDSGRIELGTYLTINSDYGSFYLGSARTSDQ